MVLKYYIVVSYFCWKKSYSLYLIRILLWILYSITKVRSAAEMGSKHEITIHNGPLLFSLSYPQKDHHVCTLKSAPTYPTSCKLNYFFFMVIEHNFSVRCTLNKKSNHSEICSLFLTQRFIYRMAKIVLKSIWLGTYI